MIYRIETRFDVEAESGDDAINTAHDAIATLPASVMNPEITAVFDEYWEEV